MSALDTLPPAFAGIDLLINNAGLARGLDPAQEADLADWELMIDTKPDKIQALIDINRNIAAGLMKQVKPLPGQQAQKPDADKPVKSTIDSVT